MRPERCSCAYLCGLEAGHGRLPLVVGTRSCFTAFSWAFAVAPCDSLRSPRLVINGTTFGATGQGSGWDTQNTRVSAPDGVYRRDRSRTLGHCTKCLPGSNPSLVPRPLLRCRKFGSMGIMLVARTNSAGFWTARLSQTAIVASVPCRRQASLPPRQLMIRRRQPLGSAALRYVALVCQPGGDAGHSVAGRGASAWPRPGANDAALRTRQ